MFRCSIFALALALLPSAASAGAPTGPRFGVNLSGCEFKVEICPSVADIAFYADAGVQTIRLPVHADRLATDAKVAKLKALVEAGTRRGVLMIVDDHRYKDIGDPSVEALWRRLGPVFKGNRLVAFDLENEPNGGTWASYGASAKTLIANLRRAGVDNLLLLEWRQSSGAARADKGEGRAKACESAVCSLTRAPGPLDPLNRTWLSPHRYLDSSGAGISRYCRGDLSPSGALGNSTGAARKLGLKLFLGEFAFGHAGGTTNACSTLGPQVLAYMKANSDVWMGAAIWGAGRAWSGKYVFKLEKTSDRAGTFATVYGRVITSTWER